MPTHHDGDPRPPRVTSGLRLGTPAVTTRGLTESHMTSIADWIDDVLGSAGDASVCERVRADVRSLCEAFPVCGEVAGTRA